MKHYLIYFTETRNPDCELSTEFIGDVDEKYLIRHFGLNEPDVLSYRIEEVNNTNTIII